MSTPTTVDWSRWSVVLLKPDCVARELVPAVMDRIGTVATVVDQRIVTVTQEQIFAHYDDLLTTRRAYFTWADVPADLRRHYVGRRAGIALVYARDAAARLRDLLGHYDPSQADPTSIRGRFGQDSLRQAQAEHRLLENVIHSSDDPEGAEREFGIWYGPAGRYLLRPPAIREESHR